MNRGMALLSVTMVSGPHASNALEDQYSEFRIKVWALIGMRDGINQETHARYRVFEGYMLLTNWLCTPSHQP